jgi:hypothetical protein
MASLPLRGSLRSNVRDSGFTVGRVNDNGRIHNRVGLCSAI